MEQTLDANCKLYLNTFLFFPLPLFQKHANCNPFFLMTTQISHNKHHKHMFTCLFPFPKIIVISFLFQTIQNKYFKHMSITINTSNIFKHIQ